MKRAARLSNVPPYHFARWAIRVQAARQKGMDVIRLDMGNPDLPPPDEVIEALCQSARQPDHHGYPGYRGLPVLHEAIAEYYERNFGVSLDPRDEVVSLLGSKEGLIYIALACADPGDLVLVPDPGYGPYANGAVLAGAQVYTVPLLAQSGFLPDLDAIPDDVADRAVLMWLNYPNNPTGATADLDFFTRAVAFARRHDILLCHDAPYSGVTYDGYVAPSMLQVEGASDVAIEFNSLSKTYNMPGWRLGMAVGNRDALASLAQIRSNIGSGTFHPLQDAAVRALSISPGWLAERNEIYRERLEIVQRGLDAVGIEMSRARATLYAWVRIPPGWASSKEFALALLEGVGVSVAPGTFFGPAGEGYVRVSVTSPTERVREAMDRVRSFTPSLAAQPDS